MEIKNYFAQDAQGNIMPSANCYLYLPGTTTLATGLVDGNGVPISNPFLASGMGQITFGAPNGVYDLRVALGDRDWTIKVQCADIVQAMDVMDSILGSHAENPTTRNNGQPLEPGDETWNSTDKQPYWWNGADWVALNSSAQELEERLASPEGSDLNGFIQSGLGAVARTVQGKLRDQVSVVDFGAIGDGISLCDAAGAAAEIVSKQIYVPAGVWRFSTPMVHGIKTQFFGPGVLKYDRAEWFRAGGSAGSAVSMERFTLFFQYESEADVFCEVDGVAQPITWINRATIEVPAPPVGTKVKYGVFNGTLPLGNVPESVYQYGMFSQVPPRHAPVMLETYATRGFNCTAYGARALQNLETGSNNTAVGSRALESTGIAGNNTAVGFQTLYRATGGGNTGVGSACAEWLTTGEYNAFVGQNAGSKVVTGSYNAVLGYQALGESAAASYTVAVGHRALGNSGANYDVSNNVAVGAFAGDFCRGQQNSFVGYRAGTGPNSGSDGEGNVAIGFFAMRNQNGADFNTSIGVGTLSALTNGQYNVALGYEAGSGQTTGNHNISIGNRAGAATLVSDSIAIGNKAMLLTTTGANNIAIGVNSLADNISGAMNTALGVSALYHTTANENTAVGYNSLLTLSTGIYNTAIGSRSARLSTTGSSNTAIGRDALYNNTTGGNNTAVGVEALKVDQSGAAQTTFGNATGLGYGASVSGSNQVQLGNSSTTAYAYGTVQNRSDLRDKADVRETSLGLEFVLGLRPVEGKWDMREDYYEDVEYIDEDGEVQTKRNMLPKDGSKVRDRFHQWFIAQDVKTLCDRLGVDFGGYQDHKLNGGCDVLSLGYDEFIPVLTKAVQEIHEKLSGMEDRLIALETK